MTKMVTTVTTPIYGKNINKKQKSYDLENCHAVSCHHGPKLHKVYIHDDSRLTLTYFKARSDMGV